MEPNDENSATNSDPSAPPPVRSADSEPAARVLGEPSADLEQARAQLVQATQERESALELAALQQAMLAAHRRAVLAENSGQVVPELVQGATADEIDASIETAKAAYARIADSVRAATLPETSPLPIVAASASPRGEAPTDDLSPLQKITSALGRNGR